MWTWPTLWVARDMSQVWKAWLEIRDDPWASWKQLASTSFRIKQHFLTTVFSQLLPGTHHQQHQSAEFLRQRLDEVFLNSIVMEWRAPGSQGSSQVVCEQSKHADSFRVQPKVNSNRNLFCNLRLAFGIGSGYTSIRHARLVGETYDSDLLTSLGWMINGHNVFPPLNCAAARRNLWARTLIPVCSHQPESTCPGTSGNVEFTNGLWSKGCHCPVKFPIGQSLWKHLLTMTPFKWLNGHSSCRRILNPGSNLLSMSMSMCFVFGLWKINKCPPTNNSNKWFNIAGKKSYRWWAPECLSRWFLITSGVLGFYEAGLSQPSSLHGQQAVGIISRVHPLL